jgi:hypothetical protein
VLSLNISTGTSLRLAFPDVVDASLIQADANKQNSTPQKDWGCC